GFVGTLRRQSRCHRGFEGGIDPQGRVRGSARFAAAAIQPTLAPSPRPSPLRGEGTTDAIQFKEMGAARRGSGGAWGGLELTKTRHDLVSPRRRPGGPY